jgi:diguanylate cyclase (GGDEF)-like protein/PAS domain S-box-containing protein
MSDSPDTITIDRAEYTRLQQREAMYSSLYMAMTEGVVLHDLVTDDTGTPVDYRILEVNPAFEAITGLSRADVVGRLASVVYQVGIPPYLEHYVHVVHTGESATFETTFAPMQKTFRITAFVTAPGQFATVFSDVTAYQQAEAALRESENRYRTVSELTSDYAYAFRIDRDGSIVPEWVTDAFTRITGYSPEEISFTQIIYPADHAIAAMRFQRLLEEQADVSEFRILARSGAIRWLRDHGHPVWDEEAGRVTCIYGAAQDITERKQAELALWESEARYRAVSELTSDFAFALRVNPDGEPVPEWITDAFTRITGLTREDAEDPAKMNSIVYPDDILRLSQHQAQVLAGHDPGLIEFRIFRQGDVRWLRHYFKPVWDAEAGRVVRIYGAAQDITEQKQYQQQIEHLAFTDHLTGLANRRRLAEAGETALAIAPERTALLYLDLDRFKAFNDSLGHDTGDMLLGQVSRRLQQVVGQAGLLARMGGDEFAVLMTNAEPDAPLALATALLEHLRQPFDLSTLRVYLSGSIGVAWGQVHLPGFSTLLTRADVAMYRAKRTQTGIQVYDPVGSGGSLEQMRIEAEFRQVLDAGSLTLHYQPILDMETGDLFAVEALVRWHHPRYGLLPPARFLPLAEEIGLLGALDTWVLQAALTQAARWQAAGTPRTVTVNLAAPSFRRVDLIEQIQTVLRETGVPAERLVIELTERTALHDLSLISQVLIAVQALGVRVALDDFGTGYASLTHLRELPVDILKIERVFAAGIGHNPRDEAVLRAVLELGTGLELIVITEGVETEAQLAWLRGVGCRHVQGYLIGRPMPAADLDGHYPGAASR